MFWYCELYCNLVSSMCTVCGKWGAKGTVCSILMSCPISRWDGTKQSWNSAFGGWWIICSSEPCPVTKRWLKCANTKICFFKIRGNTFPWFEPLLGHFQFIFTVECWWIYYGILVNLIQVEILLLYIFGWALHFLLSQDSSLGYLVPYNCQEPQMITRNRHISNRNRQIQTRNYR